MKKLALFLAVLFLVACEGPTAEVLEDAAEVMGNDFVCGENKVEDSDGNWYKTAYFDVDGGHDVAKEGQCWMVENLNVGTVILDPEEVPSDDGVVEKWCMEEMLHGMEHGGIYQKKDVRKQISFPENCQEYGGLYSWKELKKYDEVTIQGLCPTGWGIPTSENFAELRADLVLQLPPLKNPKFYADIDMEHEAKVRGKFVEEEFNAPLAGLYLRERFKDHGLSTAYWAVKPRVHKLDQNCYIHVSSYHQGGPGGSWHSSCSLSDVYPESLRNKSHELTGRYVRCVKKD